MSIFLRGEVYHYEFELFGRRFRGSTGHKNKTAARHFEAKKMTQVRETGPSAPVRKAPTLAGFSNKFLKYNADRVAAGTLDSDTASYYSSGWNLLNKTRIAHVRLDQIGAADIETLEFPRGPWNAQLGQKTLRRMLNLASEWNYIGRVPKIKLDKVGGRSVRITQEIEEALLKKMEQDCADAFVIMLDCGMRPEEVLRMRWEHIDWDGERYFNPFGKTAASRRWVPVSLRMRDRLRVREQGAKSEWVFPGKSKAGHRKTVLKQFNQARKAAKLPATIVLYCARHEFATTYLEQGGDIMRLMKVLGHTSLMVTQKYLHPDIEGAADVVNARNKKRKLHIVRKESA